MTKNGVETYKGIKVQTGIEKRSKKLKKKPKRKYPKFDYEEGLSTGMLIASLLSMERGISRPLSAGYSMIDGMTMAKLCIGQLVDEYSYSSKQIFEILKVNKVGNPEFLLEYVMKDGDVPERICTFEGCPIIMTTELLMKDSECGRHTKEE